MRANIPLAILFWLAPHMALAGECQQLTTSVITTCYAAGSEPTPPPTKAPTPVPTNQVSCDMPGCPVCDCAECVQTSIYITVFQVFCTEGIMDQAYTVTEVYKGMSSLPSFAEPTEVPYGFTACLETCTVCGPTPITATMTYPTAGAPFATDMPVPAGWQPPPPKDDQRCPGPTCPANNNNPEPALEGSPGTQPQGHEPQGKPSNPSQDSSQNPPQKPPADSPSKESLSNEPPQATPTGARSSQPLVPPVSVATRASLVSWIMAAVFVLPAVVGYWLWI